eukprot:CFRG4405T1
MVDLAEAAATTAKQQRKIALSIGKLQCYSHEDHLKGLKRIAGDTTLDLSFHDIKRLHRKTIKAAEKTNVNTADLRKDVESHNQVFQNLQYEKSLLVRDINECRSVRSRHEEIEMVSEAEFFSEATADLTTDQIKNDPHVLFCARLKWEKIQRVRLLEKEKELHATILAMKEKIRIKREKCEVGPTLSNLIKKITPLYKHLAVDYNNQDRIDATDIRESLLPPALYALYANLTAYSHSSSKVKCTVSVKGKADNAIEYNNDTEGILGKEKEQEQEIENDDDDDDDDEDYVHRRKADSKSSTTLTRPQVLASHPLSVVVEFTDPAEFDLVFYSFPYVSMTTVRASVKYRKNPPTLTHLASAEATEIVDIDDGSKPPQCTNLELLDASRSEYTFRVLLVGGKGEGKSSLALSAGNANMDVSESVGEGGEDGDGDGNESEGESGAKQMIVGSESESMSEILNVNSCADENVSVTNGQKVNTPSLPTIKTTDTSQSTPPSSSTRTLSPTTIMQTHPKVQALTNATTRTSTTQRFITLPNGVKVTLVLSEGIIKANGKVSTTQVSQSDAVVVVYSALTEYPDGDSRVGASYAKAIYSKVKEAVAVGQVAALVRCLCTKGDTMKIGKKPALVQESDQVVSATVGDGVGEWFDALGLALWEKAKTRDDQWLSLLQRSHGIPFEWVQRLCTTNVKIPPSYTNTLTHEQVDINTQEECEHEHGYPHAHPHTSTLSGAERRREFASIIGLVCDRMTVKKDLYLQVNALGKKRIDLSSPMFTDVQDMFQLRPTATLSDWSQTMESQKSSRYLMQLTRSGWVLQATITIDVNYPRTPPSFTLVMKSKGQATAEPDMASVLRHMEIDVNVYWKELVANDEAVINYLLTLQIRRLQMMFDMYVHMLQSTDSRGVMIGKLYERQRRGKDRHLPTGYRGDMRVFTHR